MLPCERCGREVAVRSKGLCPACRKKELPAKTYRKKKVEGLSDFYKRHIERIERVGLSYTGRSIHFASSCNVCHVFPKRIYESVSMDDDNIVYLTNKEHDIFDRYLDSMDLSGLKERYPILYTLAMSSYRKIKGRIKERGRLITAFETEEESDNRK